MTTAASVGSDHQVDAPPLLCPTTGGEMHQQPRVVQVGSWLTPQDLADVAIGHALVGVADGVRDRLATARAVVDQALAAGTPT